MAVRHAIRIDGARGAHARAPAARPRRGFTLISMIVAIVLLTVGILALGNANTNTIKLPDDGAEPHQCGGHRPGVPRGGALAQPVDARLRGLP